MARNKIAKPNISDFSEKYQTYPNMNNFVLGDCVYKKRSKNKAYGIGNSEMELAANDTLFYALPMNTGLSLSSVFTVAVLIIPTLLTTHVKTTNKRLNHLDKFSRAVSEFEVQICHN